MGGKRVNMARTACLVLCLAALPALVAAQEGETNVIRQVIEKERSSRWRRSGRRVARLGQDNKLTPEEVHQATEEVLHEGSGMLIFAAASMMFALLIGNILHEFEVSFISESMVIILIGYVLGIILPTQGLAMAGVLNLFLLPIIIFEAGWSMNHRAFVDLMLTILTFAVLGTLISMVVVGLLINATCDVHGVCSVRAAFTYAALISAVDPATLATYAHLQVDPLLNICVFGESVVNDAVAIVLFRVLNTGGLFTDTSFNVVSGRRLPQHPGIASQTSLLLFGSVGLGVLLGFMLMSLGQRLITKVSRLTHSTSNCVLFMFLSSFFIYSFAERACGMSGIITVLFGAMFASAFAKYQFSSEVTMFCAFTLKQAATLADMVVFLMVGITAVYCDVEGLVLGLLVCAFCLVGRAAAVFPLALLTNLCKEMYRRGQPPEKKLTLDWRKIFMMWHAGLRGGIALVLTLELGPWVDQEKPGTKDRLRNATVLVIVVSSVGRSWRFPHQLQMLASFAAYHEAALAAAAAACSARSLSSGIVEDELLLSIRAI
eukprot:g8863.t1